MNKTICDCGGAAAIGLIMSERVNHPGEIIPEVISLHICRECGMSWDVTSSTIPYAFKIALNKKTNMKTENFMCNHDSVGQVLHWHTCDCNESCKCQDSAQMGRGFWFSVNVCNDCDEELL